MTIFESLRLKFFKGYIQNLVLITIDSLKSSKFYVNVIKSYKGSGIKFVSFYVYWASFIVSVMMLLQISNIKSFLDSPNSQPNNYVTSVIASILANWEPLEFDGKSIRTNENLPKYIKDFDNRNIILIDPEKLVPANKYNDFYIIFNKHNIVFNVPYSGKIVSQEYSDIFKKNSSRFIDKEDIKNLLSDFSKTSLNILIYIGFPLIFLVNIINVILSEVLLLVLLIFISKIILKLNYSFKDLFRGVMFSIGFASFFSVLSIIAREFYFISLLIHLYTIFLLAKAIGYSRSHN